jgi:hypothetical protein
VAERASAKTATTTGAARERSRVCAAQERGSAARRKTTANFEVVSRLWPAHLPCVAPLVTKKQEPWMSDDSKTTQATIDNHLRAFFRRSIDGVLEDYAADAVLVIPAGPLRGVAEIRKFFANFIEALPSGFWDAFKLRRQEFVGELGYILWDAEPWVQFATDTFVVRDGKIVLQTFAPYPAAW